MKKIILLFALSLTSLISFSQHINGMVLDKETNKPLEGVHVYINTTDIGTLTNDKGTFYLKLPPNIRKKDVICFSYVGYKTLEIPYSKIKNKHQIYLNRNIINITEIKLSQKRKLNTKLPYTKLASMKIGLHSFGSILNDNKIYVVGGDASFEINGFQQTMTESSNMSFKELLKKASSNYSNHTYKANLLTYDIDLNNLPPHCPDDAYVLKPDFVFFGESIPGTAHLLSSEESQIAEVFLLIGTTGEVMPAAMVPKFAKENGATIIEINPDESLYTNEITDIFLKGKAGEILPELVRKLMAG